MTVITDEQAKHHVAEKVVWLLKERGWTMKDLADRTGDSFMMISRVCKAQNMAGYGVIARIAEAFGITIDDLLSPPPRRISRTSA